MIKNMNDLSHLSEKKNVILLYSGGLDSTFLICYLSRVLKLHVYALFVDVGQREDFITHNFSSEEVTFISVNKKIDFANEFVIPSIMAGGLYNGRHPLSASLSRPLLAKCAFELAEKYCSEVIIHSATSTQNTMRRINGSLQDLGFSGEFGSPFFDSTPSRIEKIEFLKSHGMLFGNNERRFSYDTNLWCREIESGDFDNCEKFAYPEHCYELTGKDPSICFEEVTLLFENGQFTSLNGKYLPFFSLVELLNAHCGVSSFGRYSSLEEFQRSKKVLEVRESPAACLLISGYRHLLSACVDEDVIFHFEQLSSIWFKEASEGRWFGVLKKSLDAFFNTIKNEVSGEVSFILKDGSYILAGVKSFSTKKYLLDREQYETLLKVS